MSISYSPMHKHPQERPASWGVYRGEMLLATFTRKKLLMAFMESCGDSLSESAPYDWHKLLCLNCGINCELLRNDVGNTLCRECLDKEMDEEHGEVGA